MPIPLGIALFDRGSGAKREERLIVLDKAEDAFRFDGVGETPALSINRGFTAPVRIERGVAREELAFLARNDDDPFARYEAMQDLVVGHLIGAGEDGAGAAAEEESIAHALSAIVADTGLDDLMRGELMLLPGVTYLMDQVEVADPWRIFAAREGLKKAIGEALGEELAALYDRAAAVPFSQSSEAKGARKVKTIALTYLAASDPVRAAELAETQYDAADNMTDRQGALMVLTGLSGAGRTAKLLDFHKRFAGNELVIDKWFALQASSLHPHVVEHVEALADHPDFTLRNPNRVRSLYMAFAGNPHGFHHKSGKGYRMIADLILALDPINAQTAARFVPSLGRWRRIEQKRAETMREQLERIAAAPALSRDTYEQVTRSLG